MKPHRGTTITDLEDIVARRSAKQALDEVGPDASLIEASKRQKEIAMGFQGFKDSIAKEAHGMTAAQAQKTGICIDCKQLALPKCHTDAGRREYRISAICEECWDAMFAEEEE